MPPARNIPIPLRRELLNSWLLLLVRLSPNHGYELRERLGKVGLSAATSSVYRGLRQLESDGLVQSEWRASSAGAPQRVYRVTPKGHQSLERYAQIFADARDSFNLFVTQYEGAIAPRERSG